MVLKVKFICTNLKDIHVHVHGLVSIDGIFKKTAKVNILMHTMRVSICGALTALSQVVKNSCGKL